MDLNRITTVTSPTPLPRLACNRIFICDNVWECMEKHECEFAYTYGGDCFCKLPVKAEVIEIIGRKAKSLASA